MGQTEHRTRILERTIQSTSLRSRRGSLTMPGLNWQNLATSAFIQTWILSTIRTMYRIESRSFIWLLYTDVSGYCFRYLVRVRLGCFVEFKRIGKVYLGDRMDWNLTLDTICTNLNIAHHEKRHSNRLQKMETIWTFSSLLCWYGNISSALF